MAEVLKAPESITVASSPAFAEAVEVGLAEHDALALDLGALREADLSFVQIVCAARELAARSAKAFSIAGPIPATVEQLLRRAGFLDSPSPEDLAFWLSGAAPQ